MKEPGRHNLEVVVINDFAHVNGGAAKVAIESACGLATAGVPVTYFSAVAPIERRLLDAGVEVVCLDETDIANSSNRFSAFVKGLWNRNAAARLAELLSAKSPRGTIIHVHGWSKALSSSVFKVATSLGFPVVVTLHDYFSVCPNGGLFDYQAGEACWRRPMSASCVFRNCDVRKYSHKLWRLLRQCIQGRWGGLPKGLKHYIYMTDFSLEKMRHYLPGEANFFRVTNPVEMSMAGARALPETPRFVAVGRLSVEKGVEVFARAVAKLGIAGVVVGDGPQKEQLQKQFPELHFTGWLPPEEVHQELLNSTALVFPSLCYETQGLVVYEASALGVPAVVSTGCAASDYVEHGVTGMHFRTGDPDDLAMILQKLSEDEAFVEALGVQAIRRYNRSPSGVGTHVGELMSVYRQILGEGGSVE